MLGDGPVCHWEVLGEPGGTPPQVGDQACLLATLGVGVVSRLPSTSREVLEVFGIAKTLPLRLNRKRVTPPHTKSFKSLQTPQQLLPAAQLCRLERDVHHCSVGVGSSGSKNAGHIQQSQDGKCPGKGVPYWHEAHRSAQGRHNQVARAAAERQGE